VPPPTTYEEICLCELGPVAFDPEMTCHVETFQDHVLSGRMEYTALSHGVPAPPQHDYGHRIQPLHAGEPPRGSLKDAMDENMAIREILERNVERLQVSLPQPWMIGINHGQPGQIGTEMERLVDYFRIKLSIQVIRATGLPAPDWVGQSDPYIKVSVLDGDPLGHEANTGGPQWYTSHEQWQGRTVGLEDTLNPEWRSILTAPEVKPWSCTCLHFQMFDKEDIRADRPIGQAIVPMADVVLDKWFAARAVALIPMDRADQQAWASLVDARLHIAISWEGIKSEVKHRPQGFADLGIHGRRARTRERRQRRAGSAESVGGGSASADAGGAAVGRVRSARTRGGRRRGAASPEINDGSTSAGKSGGATRGGRRRRAAGPESAAAMGNASGAASSRERPAKSPGKARHGAGGARGEGSAKSPNRPRRGR